MTEITTFIDFIQNIGFVGLLIILAIPSLRKKIFNGNDGHKTMIEIRDNHLHEIKEILKEMRDDHRICSNRIENKLDNINEHMIYLKTKHQNGK